MAKRWTIRELLESPIEELRAIPQEIVDSWGKGKRLQVFEERIQAADALQSVHNKKNKQQVPPQTAPTKTGPSHRQLGALVKNEKIIKKNKRRVENRIKKKQSHSDYLMRFHREGVALAKEQLPGLLKTPITCMEGMCTHGENGKPFSGALSDTITRRFFFREGEGVNRVEDRIEVEFPAFMMWSKHALSVIVEDYNAAAQGEEPQRHGTALIVCYSCALEIADDEDELLLNRLIEAYQKENPHASKAVLEQRARDDYFGVRENGSWKITPIQPVNWFFPAMAVATPRAIRQLSDNAKINRRKKRHEDNDHVEFG